MPYQPAPLRPHPAAMPLHGPEDALSVILTAASRPARPESIVLVLDHAHRGLGCIVVVGDGPIGPVAEMLDHFTASEPQVAALVLASVRTGPESEAGAGRGDLLAFHDLRARFDAVGVDIVDWFVVVGQHAASLAELTDSTPRWRPRR